MAPTVGVAALVLMLSCGVQVTHTDSSPATSTNGTLASAPTSTLFLVVPPLASTLPPEVSVPSATALPPPSAVSTSTTANLPTAMGVDDLVLRPDGLGALSFGMNSTSVLGSLTPVFGVPDYDQSQEYQLDADSGRWENGAAVFTHPFSRTVCWSEVLCLTFGGDSSDDLNFVEWSYQDAGPTAYGLDARAIGPLALSTADGISMGSKMSDHLDSILPQMAPCYSSAFGRTIDGMSVSLYSIGDPFFRYDDAGAMIVGNPPPEDIIVVGLMVGDRVADLDEDC